MKQNHTENKRKRGLDRKLLTSIVILALLISLASCLIGYMQYSNTIYRLYNENGYVVGEIILDAIDTDEVAKYAKTWQEDDYYAQMVSYLKSVEEASGAAYIYMIVPEENETMRYIYDSSGLSIGDTDPVSMNYDKVVYTYETGERTDDYYVRHSQKYGYLTSSVLPVKDSSGDTVAVLFVDIHMKLVVSTLTRYIFRVVLISLLLLLIFCILYWNFMKNSVLRPIKIIRKNAHDFAESDAQLTDTLSQIRTGDELQELAESISSMEHSIVEYIDYIKNVTAEKERIGAELGVATQIQADMLPSIFPAFPERDEFDIYATMHPAKEVGGDFYDFFLVDEDHLAMVIADVSGKGVPAALFMVIAKTLLKNRAQMGASPREILEIVNQQLCENNKAEMFVTVWLGIMEISTGRVAAANAGHEYPVLKRADGAFEVFKDKHGFVLAGMEGMKYTEYEFVLDPGDCLFVYTDGVPEATNAQNELFGMERLLTVLNQNRGAQLENLLDGVKTGIDSFVGDAPQFDDITMLAVVRTDKGQKPAEITVDAKVEKITEVTAFIDEQLKKQGCPENVQMQIDVAVDELFGNIARYAYPEGAGRATVRIEPDPERQEVSITFLDRGIPYDPLQKEDPDVTLSAEERKIGGLGIYIVKKSMDAVSYRYENGQNILCILKKY